MMDLYIMYGVASEYNYNEEWIVAAYFSENEAVFHKNKAEKEADDIYNSNVSFNPWSSMGSKIKYDPNKESIDRDIYERKYEIRKIEVNKTVGEFLLKRLEVK